MCSYEALVDGLRQGPSSFASLVYHSQLAYELLAMDGRPRAVRFRLIARHDHRDNTVRRYITIFTTLSKCYLCRPTVLKVWTVGGRSWMANRRLFSRLTRRRPQPLLGSLQPGRQHKLEINAYSVVNN